MARPISGDYLPKGSAVVTITDIPERITSKINFGGDNGCWLWLGWRHRQTGYPYSSLDGRDQLAYRVVYQLAVGPIPDGLELDHLCNVPLCVNPDHLEPVTHAENMRRIRDRQMSCRKAGHDWTNRHNVRQRPDGSRYCAECDRQQLRARYVPTGRPQNGTQTHCKHGHPFDEENSYVYTNPSSGRTQRRCRACIRAQNRKS